MAIANDITSALARPQTLAEDWPQLGHSDDWAPGQQVGPYRLKQRLGKGGMGVVWLAEQLQPLQREVAIKVMAGERRDAWAETWFEIERQALAQLSHRGIAQIHDAGRLPDGALFFAMEYVPGVPLDEFQLQHPLDPRALAALFLQICAAVQHAHQRGLIHRDLKPLNVLVQMLDGEPVAKIIDFGIAVRALPGVATPFRVDRVVGTPAYMSPEQKQPGAGGIDARCDIYALGVMLGEALCRAGGPPADRESIDVTAVHGAVCLELGRNAFERSVAADALRPRLKRAPRELLAIAAKAMSADRETRYESAAAMADDLARWLARRPVLAMGGGRLYAFRCLVRRNRIASLAATLVLAAILGGSVLAWTGMREAQRARALAEQRRGDAEQLIQFMLGDFADKLRPIGRLDLLDSIGQEALRYLSAQDASGDAVSVLSRARALRTLGEVMVTRQQFPDAAGILERAAGLLAVDPASFEPQVRADLHFESGQIAHYRGVIAYRQGDLPQAGQHWNRYLTEATAFAQSNPDAVAGTREVAFALNNLGTLAYAQSDFAQALGFFERASAARRRILTDAADPASLELANSISWIATCQEKLDAMASAWSSRHEALALVLAYGRHRVDADQRSREMNFRLTLAQMATNFDLRAYASTLLQPALQIAVEDVASDPTQPRRLLMLARIALLRAQIANAGDSAGEAALIEARRAVSSMQTMNIAEGERLELATWLCLVESEWAPTAPACVAKQLDAALAGPVDALRVSEWLRVVALFGVLHKADPTAAVQYANALLQALQGRKGVAERTYQELLLQREIRIHGLMSDDDLPQLQVEISRRQAELSPIPEEEP